MSRHTILRKLAIKSYRIFNSSCSGNDLVVATLDLTVGVIVGVIVVVIVEVIVEVIVWVVCWKKQSGEEGDYSLVCMLLINIAGREIQTE